MHISPRCLSFAAALVAIGAAIAPAQTTTSATTTAPTTGAGDARPLTVRGGIPNVAAKLKAGGHVAVAFIGGPITAAGGGRGYAPLVVRWLGSQYPGTRVRLVNAGLVDGGSALGAARFERDVFPHKPDLLLVEFAVDDIGRDDRLRHVERLVHKAWSADPTTDLVMIYAIDDAQRGDYRAGKLPPAASLHERVAEHYGIPSIAMGMDMIARLDAGKAKWVELFYDASHPTPNGHSAYADAVIAAMQTLLADDAPQAPGKHELKAPLTRGLALRPTSRRATTMPAPAAMTDGAGRTARATYAMPLVGTHWVGSPDFTDADGRVLWRLFTQSARDNGRRLNDGFGLDRSRWGPPMQWFDEWNHFTGPAGVYLVHGVDGKLNHIAARENDLPIVTFTALRAGRYVVRVKSAGVTVWGLHHALAMSVVHFPAGQTKGKSIAFHRTQARIAQSPNIEVEVRLAEGDDIAFELDTNAIGGGGGAVYRDAEITVGWFGE